MCLEYNHRSGNAAKSVPMSCTMNQEHQLLHAPPSLSVCESLHTKSGAIAIQKRGQVNINIEKMSSWTHTFQDTWVWKKTVCN